jgi:hypothetical protein
MRKASISTLGPSSGIRRNGGRAAHNRHENRFPNSVWHGHSRRPVRAATVARETKRTLLALHALTCNGTPNTACVKVVAVGHFYALT